ncbi:hypothetical protein [Paraburkholderia sp. Tr-20389]|uniref:hypothetical protein n=1 Tax=Paraburkholderia sp. Tr-20389 TaxID=2703903 RepID=UPI00197DE34C|nr:hypothetical protein [Paraburkholderia sp. Tr-20389]
MRPMQSVCAKRLLNLSALVCSGLTAPLAIADGWAIDDRKFVVGGALGQSNVFHPMLDLSDNWPDYRVAKADVRGQSLGGKLSAGFEPLTYNDGFGTFRFGIDAESFELGTLEWERQNSYARHEYFMQYGTAVYASVHYTVGPVGIVGKIGEAMVMTRIREEKDPIKYVKIDRAPIPDDLVRKTYAPSTSIGLTYSVNKNVEFCCEWQKLLARDSLAGDKGPIQTDFVSAGLLYRF